MTAEDSISPGPGRIITFYSYKGGSGRTMALANVAWILASNGYRVLTVDWDLESPGLHRYFHPFLVDKTLRSSRGVIELVREFAADTMEPASAATDEDSTWFEQKARILPYAASLDWYFPHDGSIDFVPAGQQTSAYSQTVSTFDWVSFYNRQGGGAFLDALRRDMLKQYDYVLIDSRTGMSDTAGICTVRLPDVVATCFTLSSQSVDGSVAVANSILGQRGERVLHIRPVLMRIDASEKNKLDAGRDYARERFAPILRQSSVDDVTRYWAQAEIPYVPFFAFEEILAPFGDQPGLPTSLLAAFERLTGALTDGRVNGLEPLAERDRLDWLALFERPRPASITDVVISYAARDRIWAEWITAELQTAGLRVVLRAIDETPPPESEPWMTSTPRSTRVLTLLSEDYLADEKASHLWRTLTTGSSPQGRRVIVPIRLDNVRLTPPFTDMVPVDLADQSAQRSRDGLFLALNLPLPGRGSVAGSASAAATARYPVSMPPIFNVPQRYDLFTGRTDILQRIRDQFCRIGSRPMPQLLYGLDGVGKTRIAIEYAYRFAADYDLVWWTSAEQPSVVRASLAHLASTLGLPPAESLSTSVDAVLDTLKRTDTGRRWLLILDNADDPSVLADSLPAHASGHVLITSKTPASTTSVALLEVGVFQREQAMALLAKRVPGLSPEDNYRVAQELGDLPLAIEQAGAWLSATSMPVADYLELLAERLPEILLGNQPEDYPRAAAASWLLSLDRLRSRTPAAARLLELCASLASEPIPMWLLSGERVASLLAAYDPALRDPMLLRQVVGEIARYSLARIDPGRGGVESQSTVEVHRLVQLVVRRQLDEAQRAETDRQVLGILAAANPKETDDTATWPRFAQLWPHVATLALDSDLDDVRQLVADMIRYVWRTGDYATSRDFAERAIERWMPVYGPDDKTTLLVRYHLANVLWSVGDFETALATAEDVLARLTQTVGATHPYSLITAMALSADLRALGQYERARDMDVKTLERSRDVFGEDHLRTLNAANNLAVSLRMVGDFVEAKMIDEQTLSRRRTHLGRNHHSSLLSAANLGRDLREMGDFQSSRRYLEEAAEALAEILGSDHEDAIRTLKSLAVTLRMLGDFDFAYERTRQALERAEKVLGPTHPDTLAIRLNLACDESALQDHEAATVTAAAVRELYLTRLGEDHSFTLAATNNLSVFTREVGRVSDAIRLSATAYQGLLTLLGELHPYTLAARLNYGSDLFAVGDVKAARSLDEETYQKFCGRLGDTHPDTLAAGANVAISRRRDGDHAAADRLHQQIIEQVEETLGELHPNSRAIRSGIRLSCLLEPPPT